MKLVCYCFEKTAEDIRRDLREHGESSILEQILAAKRTGNCRCAETHPEGR